MIKDNILSIRNFLEKPHIENVIVDVKEPIPLDKFEDTEYEFAIKIVDEIKNIYSFFNGLEIKWRFYPEKVKKGYELIEGSIQILNFQDMIIDFEGRKWLNEIWSEKTKKEDLDFFQRLKPFDYYGPEADQFVCLELSPERVLTSKLWIFSTDHYPLRMNVKIEKYFEVLEKSKGVRGWQYFYTDIDLNKEINYRIKENCEFIIETYPKIFDDGFEEELKMLFKKLSK